MPSNPRQQIKQDLATVRNSLTKAMELLAVTGTKYEATHPEITEHYHTVFNWVQQGREMVDGLASEA